MPGASRLAAWFLACVPLALAAAELSVVEIPRVPDEWPADHGELTAEPWGGYGFRLEALGIEGKDGAPSMELAARARMGWNSAGFRFLVEVRDSTPFEDGALWYGDSVEIFLSNDIGAGNPRGQVVVAPGRDPQWPEPRVSVFEGLENHVPDPRYAVRKNDHGYAVEILVPWADVGVEPEEGLALAVSVAVNDRTVRDGPHHRRRWIRQALGETSTRFMREVRLSSSGEGKAHLWAENFAIQKDGSVRLAIQAGDAWAGQPVEVALDGEPLGAAEFGPGDGGWTDLLFDRPGQPGTALPKRLTLRLPDGSEAVLPCRFMLPFERPLGNGWRGENYHMNACFRYLMELLGHPEGVYDYHFFSALTGDSFVQVHPGYCFSGTWRTKDDFSLLSDTVGREFDFVSGEEARSDPPRWRQAAVQAIDRGEPVICFRREDAPSVINGYEEGGERLLMVAYDAPVPEIMDEAMDRVEWLLFMGDEKPALPRDEALRRAFAAIPGWMARPRDGEGTNYGRDAYHSWADSLLDPAVRAVIVNGGDASWLAHSNQVCLTLTSEHSRGFFLREARNLCPDLAPGLDAMQAVHDRISPLHGRLNALGAGFFGPPRPWMDDQESVEEVVALIKEIGDAAAGFADCLAALEAADSGGAGPAPSPGNGRGEDLF